MNTDRQIDVQMEVKDKKWSSFHRSALTVKAEWSEMIMKRRKTIELAAHHLRKLDILKGGTIIVPLMTDSHIIGLIEIQDSFQISSEADFLRLSDFHCWSGKYDECVWQYAWRIVDVYPLTPIHVHRRSGSQRWVRIEQWESKVLEQLYN